MKKKNWVILGIILAALSVPERAGADDLFVRTMDLGRIIVSTNRAEIDENEAAENVFVFTRKDIESLPARNLTEVLEYVPNIGVQPNGLFGQSTSLSVHGSESRHVLLMVDGIPFNTQLSGQANPSQIALEHVERIEVIRGAASSVWGSGLGGVINVITKEAGTEKGLHGSWTSRFAEFGTTQNSLELKGKIKNIGFFASGSYMDTDGIKSRSDVEERKLFSKLSWQLSPSAKLTGSFGYGNADVSDIIGAKLYSRPYFTRYGQLRFDHDSGNSRFNVSYKYNHILLTSDTYNAITGAQSSFSRNRNVYQGLNIQESVDVLDDDLFVLGVDMDWHVLKSTSYLTAGKSIAMQAPYMNYTWNAGRWSITPGVRYDHNQSFGSQTSPSLGAVYRFDNSLKTSLRGKIARAFNAPPLMWVYNNDPPWAKPNYDLKAERAVVYEWGMTTKIIPSCDLKMDLDFYRSDAVDAIAWILDGGSYVARNSRKFRRQGAEMALRYSAGERWEFSAAGAFNDAQNRETGRKVRDSSIARQSFSLGAEYQTPDGLSVHMLGRYNRWSSSPSNEPNDRKFIFDVKMKKTFLKVFRDFDTEIFLNIHNITNSQYWSNINFPLPKRYFEGGFTVRF